MSSQEAQLAQARLRLLRLQEAIAKETVTFADTRLQESEVRGEISATNRSRIFTRHIREFQYLRQQVTKTETLVSLHRLETARRDITTLFENKIAELQTAITDVKVQLQDASLAPIDASSPLPYPAPTTLPVKQATKWYTSSPMIVSLILIVVLLATAPFTFGLLTDHRVLNSTGIVGSVDLEIFADPDGSQPLNLIEWGLIYPGDTATCVIYLQNTGTQNVTLQMDTTNWTPIQARDVMTLLWDYGNEIFQPTEVMQVTLSLTLASDVSDVQEFRFDIIVTTTQSS